MAQKRKIITAKLDEISVEDTYKSVPNEDNFEEVVEIAETIFIPKKKFKVVGIREDSIVVVDEKENGYIFAIEEEFKNIKVGEYVYLPT